MQTTVTVSKIFNCSLERAFKTPMLCDVSKVHTGYGIMPKVTHCTDDENWGQVGATKKVFTGKSLTQKGGFASTDSILERVENKHWKIEVSDFQSWMLGFTKFVGTWKTTELAENKIRVDYSYTFHSNGFLLYPFSWLFTKIVWRKYLKHVLANIDQMIQNEEPYLFE